jgi:hypothetical protein
MLCLVSYWVVEYSDDGVEVEGSGHKGFRLLDVLDFIIMNTNYSLPFSLTLCFPFSYIFGSWKKERGSLFSHL